jgi:hypothetical protein
MRLQATAPTWVVTCQMANLKATFWFVPATAGVLT